MRRDAPTSLLDVLGRDRYRRQRADAEGVRPNHGAHPTDRTLSQELGVAGHDLILRDAEVRRDVCKRPRSQREVPLVIVEEALVEGGVDHR
jgi:hypothetical protein